MAFFLIFAPVLLYGGEGEVIEFSLRALDHGCDGSLRGYQVKASRQWVDGACNYGELCHEAHCIEPGFVFLSDSDVSAAGGNNVDNPVD